MTGISRLRALNANEQALVCVGVLLDGHDAARYLRCDDVRGSALGRVAEELAKLPPDLRMPLIGTVYRTVAAQSAESRSEDRDFLEN